MGLSSSKALVEAPEPQGEMNTADDLSSPLTPTTLSMATQTMQFGRSMPGPYVFTIRDGKTIFQRCVSSIDMCSISDIQSIFEVLQYNTEGRPDRSRVLSTKDTLSDWCLIITLEREDLLKERSNSADVVEELSMLFPGLLSIKRFPSWTHTRDDILQIRVKTCKCCCGKDMEDFEYWLKYVAAQMPIQGCRTTIPDIHTALETSIKPDRLFAVTARRRNGLPPAVIVNGVAQIAAICVVCWQILAKSKALPTPGDTFCCKSCHAEVFDLCHVCTEPVRKALAFTMACGHKFCEACIVHAFKSGTQTIGDFPPNCCGNVLSVHKYRTLLDDTTVRQYVNLLVESEQRKDIQCATTTCDRALIKSCTFENEWGLCAQCAQITCTRCGELEKEHTIANSERSCPDKLGEQLLQLAEANNWRTCPKCNAIVSRSGGCNAMRCRCGQGFCYTCGEAYERQRTCACKMTFEVREGQAQPQEDQVALLAEPDMPAGPDMELLEISDQLLALHIRAIAGNVEAIATLRILHEQLVAADIVVTPVERMHTWVRGLWLQHEGIRAREENFATSSQLVLSWTFQLQNVLDGEIAIACQHRRMMFGFRGRCHGCERGHVERRTCLECGNSLCRICQPRDAGDLGT